MAAASSLFPLRRIFDLVRLRYRLQWAQIRSNPGAMVGAAILLAVFLLFLAGALIGGIAIGALAQAERARVLAFSVLGGMFLNLLVVTVVFGFGTHQVFSARTLRQFPLGRPERLFLQYGIGLFEPTWLLGMAIYVGCAIGAAAVGLSALWVAVPAALFLICANYLTARILLGIVERLVATTAGSIALLVLMQGAFLMPAILGEMDGVSREQLAEMARLFAFSPPAAAADIMTGAGSAGAWLALLGGCALALAGAAALERRPIATRTARGQGISWDGPIDRIAALFPAHWGPLIGRALRYYLRSPAIRVALLITLPALIIMVTRGMGPARSGQSLFARALVAAPVGAVMVTAAFAPNAFGYDASGLRRLLLCPVKPRLVLRTLAAVPLLIGVAAAWVLAAAWMLLAPEPVTGAGLTMLLAHTMAGMLVFHAVAVWPSVLSPRRVRYDQKFRNEASFGGQIGTMGGLLLIAALPIAIRFIFLPGPIANYWWLPLFVLPLAFAVYAVSLAAAERVFVRRREQLLSVVEGRG